MKKVVVVDDDPGILEFITYALKNTFSVHTAGDGAAGLELVKKERPDLVILDLLMPKMHGFEVCKKIKEDAELKATKVLISSSKSYVHDINTAKSAGADMYIVKPYELSSLLWKVEELIGGIKTPLTLKFWGTRGSIPSPGSQTQKYGGNTPCTELRVGDMLMIIDAGSGIRELGNSLMKEFKGRPIEGHIFIGHTHWDHIQGLPFFTPLYLPQNKFTIYGVHGTTQPFGEVLSNQMSPTYFPVSMKDLAAKLNVIELSKVTNIGPVKVSYHYLNHPGITVGFRIETKDWVVSYISDHEPYGRLNEKGEFSDKEDAEVARFVAGSDLLISEAQYTEEEYKSKRSWGHSTFKDVLDLALKAKVKKLALFHHDPTHTDEQMDRFMADCEKYLKEKQVDLTCFGAQEGLTVSI
jgi:phosphoribosyl 1,2-cyclic phosphodiesterase